MSEHLPLMAAHARLGQAAIVADWAKQSDFSCTFTSAVRFMAFADRSDSFESDVQEISRFSCMLFLSVRGS